MIDEQEMSENVKKNETAGKLFNQTKALIKEAKVISNIGDDAYYGGSGLKLGAGLNVLVQAKGVSFTVDLGLGFGNKDDAKHIEIETKLAQKVLGRL